jgi:GH24 family phage-related lysozyme (muramidase)
MTDTASAALILFVARHEGFVSKAYRDSGGVITIGYGFTGLSTVFAAWWRTRHGRPLKLGDTIARADADAILARVIAEEYAPPVARRFGGLPQHRFDACADATYNAGAGTLKDRWAAALAAGDAGRAAGLLRATRVTAGGKRLAGLVRRRDDEARLLETGDYGGAGSSVPTAEEVRAYQRDLAALGFYADPVDGKPASADTAVVAFQREAGLVVDGVVGPATRAALRRALDAKAGAKVAVGSAGATGAGGAILTSSQRAPDAATLGGHALGAFVGWALAAAVIALIAIFIWRNRGRILKRRTFA